MATDYVTQTTLALSRGDARSAHRWAKGWIGSGGGAWLIDPWLVYVCSALIESKPRLGLHSIDLALRNWISDATDRSVLYWVRGAILYRILNDPGGASIEFSKSLASAPSWLAAEARTDLDEATSDSAARRGKHSRVPPSPEYVGPGEFGNAVPPKVTPTVVGARPKLWDILVRYLPETRSRP